MSYISDIMKEKDNPVCKKHNEKKNIIGAFAGKYILRCESCFKEQMVGLNKDFKRMK
jgi:hypothetical protein